MYPFVFGECISLSFQLLLLFFKLNEALMIHSLSFTFCFLNPISQEQFKTDECKLNMVGKEP
jgi:hypothetical protein